MRKVSFPKARNDADGHFACVFVLLQHLARSSHDGTGADSHGQSNHPQIVTHARGPVGMNGYYLVDHGQVQILGNQAGSHALNFVRTLRSLFFTAHGFGNQHLFHGFYRHNVQIWLEGWAIKFGLALDVLRNARHRAARAHTADQNVELTVRVVPNFGPRRFAVDLGVGRVFKLLQHVALTVERVDNFVRLGQCSGDRGFLGCQDHFAAQG
mmetsp:Transcript_5050/g.14122  ORF Transcript_5050/g.14122 Transcript_5050/m.14122 type:complete len:211 (+) Transcript_5050:431-1063(+)